MGRASRILCACLSVFVFQLAFFVSAQPSSSTPVETAQNSYSTFELGTYHLGGEESRFAWRNMPGLFGHAQVNHHETRALPIELNPRLAKWTVTVAGKAMSFDEYVKSDNRIDSVMVLHQGKIIYQRFNTHGPLDRHIIWSVTKVMVGATLARLEADGKIDIQKSVAHYLPSLVQSGWGKIALQDVADMTSGIDCRDSDNYENLDSCVRKVDVAYAVSPGPKNYVQPLEKVLQGMTSQRKAGEETEYTSANTLVLAKVVEAVTGLPFNQALAKLIWQPMGAEADGLMLINQFGDTYAGGGLSVRLADVARFGLLYAPPQPEWPAMDIEHRRFLQQHRPLYSEAMQKGLARLFDGDPPLHSRWQWDLIWQDGDLYKDGYSGQGVYISPLRELVMVWFGTADKQFRKHHLLPIARQLSKSEAVLSNKQP